jgi:hypothetical protein
MKQAWNDANRARKNAFNAAYRKRYPDRSKAENQNWRKNSPEKKAAHSSLEVAVKSGAVQRSPCHICGAQVAEGHHPDYSRPRDVVWLCRLHHMQLHAEFKNYEQI